MNPNNAVGHIGIYPGTFDPVTNGHLDIIFRSTRVVDKLIIGVAKHTGKEPLFNLEEEGRPIIGVWIFPKPLVD